MAIEEGPHHSPTLRWLEVGERQIGVLNREEAENVLIGKQRVPPVRCGDGEVRLPRRLEQGEWAQVVLQGPRPPARALLLRETTPALTTKSTHLANSWLDSVNGDCD